MSRHWPRQEGKGDEMDAWYATIIYLRAAQVVTYTEDRPKVDATGTCLVIGGNGS